MSAAQAPPPYKYQAVSTSDEHEIRGEVDPDDFKIGVTVEQSAPEIRAMFVRKGVHSAVLPNPWIVHRGWRYECFSCN